MKLGQTIVTQATTCPNSVYGNFAACNGVNYVNVGVVSSVVDAVGVVENVSVVGVVVVD